LLTERDCTRRSLELADVKHLLVTGRPPAEVLFSFSGETDIMPKTARRAKSEIVTLRKISNPL
jgi:hypothetical protein